MRMKGIELVRHRRSVRTFDGNPLRQADADAILTYAKKTQNPYGIAIDWKLLSAREHGLSSPVIVGADTFIAGKVHRELHAEEAFGFAFERIVLYAESLGVGTTWIAGTMDRPAFERAMQLSPDEVMPCVSPLGYPSEKMSLRETMMRKGVKADTRLALSQLILSGSPESIFMPCQEAYEMLRWAPSAVNKQPWRMKIETDRVLFFEAKNKGFVDAYGWDIQKVDMGIALCHFMYGIEESGRTASLTICDPGFPVPHGMEYIATVTVQ